ncbi:MAG: type II secretion system protein [Phycisphaerae bacterium]|nr:type II secretion system protein [Phycisphaerae bacterium]
MTKTLRYISHRGFCGGFTLIELLVVIFVVGLLIGILMPALNLAKKQGKAIDCKNNLRQLALAATSYVHDHDGYYLFGAEDIYSGNLHRWYGVRDDKGQPFNTSKGTLSSYLNNVRLQCPSKINYKQLSPGDNDYEDGNGGYGYNLIYIGSQIWKNGYGQEGCESTAKVSEVERPQETLLFADTAMAKEIDGDFCLSKYPFAEPRFFVIYGQPDPTWSPYPSLHFRHKGYTNIVWADCHTSNKKIAINRKPNQDGTISAKYDVGWFEPMDNSPFDLR